MIKSATAANGRLRQPPGLYVLFLTEMWERFSYYGMRALLVLFLVSTVEKGGLGWTEQAASQLYGWYTGLVYLTPLIGGLIADRILGTHRSMVIGGLIIACGHFSLAMEHQATFYLGLLLIIIGTGFFKPCVSTMVGSLYGENDPRRDSGFTIFYMGINLGALIGTLICGYLGESPNWGWHYGFGAAGVGMVAGLAAYLYFRPKYLAGIGLPPTERTKAAAQESKRPLTKQEKDNILVLVVAALFVIFFWAAFEQAGSSMNLFALKNTRRELLGFDFPASWFQSVNPAMILVMGPVFAWFWMKLAKVGKEPNTITKMGIGLLLLALGFVFMAFGGAYAASGALVSPMWLTLAYAFNTFGELCLSPVGLSLVTKLAPARLASLLMGMWFLANFAANLLAGYLAGALHSIEQSSYFHFFGGQADFFLIFVIEAGVAGLLLLAIMPWLRQRMHGHT